MSIKEVLIESKKVIDPKISYLKIINENVFMGCSIKRKRKFNYLFSFKQGKIKLLGELVHMNLGEVFALGSVSLVSRISDNIFEVDIKKDNQETIKYIVYSDGEDSEVLFTQGLLN